MIQRISLLLTAMAVVLSVELLQGQDTEFQKANRLIQQQNYEEALPILQQLHTENPQATIFLDRLLDCLVNLKEYDEALEMISDQISRQGSGNQLLIRKGTIHHSLGDRETAFEIWESIVEENPDNIQFYYQIGSAMMNHREYHRAAKLYQTAREEFKESTLFMNEIASAWIQSGNYGEAMNEYFRLVMENPSQMNFVQQRLLRMQDREVLEIAAFEIEDFILDLDLSHPSYHSLHQLYMWLLIETEQYRRAFIAARQYESRTENLTYSLFSLAEQLVSNHEYEIASDAFGYYAEASNHPVRHQAKDRQSQVYKQWANYLGEHNLDDLFRRDELNMEAYRTGAELVEENPSYQQREGVLVRLAEISLDVFHDKGRAEHWIDELEKNVRDGQQANLDYLRGRLYLFNNSYSEARHSFTRAGRGSEDSDLAEKSRYFLSLTDFFSGDFDFALIQLRSLERRNVSYYANDALRLRMWIQEGQRADTSGQVLKEFAAIIEKLYSGNIHEAVEGLQPFYESGRNTLTDNALVEIASRSDIRYNPLLYKLIHDFNSRGERSPLRERLLWEQAIAGKLLFESNRQESGSQSEGKPEFSLPGLSFGDNLMFEQSDWPSSLSDVENLYEQIILEFPQGFYAPHAREELQTMTRPRS